MRAASLSSASAGSVLRTTSAPVSKTRLLSLRPAGSPEAPLSARPRLKWPGASTSFGQSAAWAELAGHTGLCFPHTPAPFSIVTLARRLFCSRTTRRPPVRISGPCVSSSTAQPPPRWLGAAVGLSLRFLRRSSTSSSVACEKLRRMRRMPASTTRGSVGSSSDAGPMVATILVSGSLSRRRAADVESRRRADMLLCARRSARRRRLRHVRDQDGGKGSGRTLYR